MDVATIRQAQLHLSYGSGDGGGGEPVAVVTAHLVLTLAKIEVVVRQVFIAQTSLGKHFTELSAVLDEGRSRLLIDFRVGGFHRHIIGSLECVCIRAMVVAVLATN